MISLSGDFYVTVTFQSAIFQIITRVQRPARIQGIILIFDPSIVLLLIVPGLDSGPEVYGPGHAIPVRAVPPGLGLG
jgi:hypothetical protein